MKFLIVIFVSLVPIDVDASIDYKAQHEMSYNSAVKKKSFRRIIREVIKRKRTETKIETETIPIPLYDSIEWDKVKNVA